jgi:hypothetical protein
MTDILFQGKPVKTLEIQQLGENFVGFKLTMADGKVHFVGYFREET